jgi:nitric oxide reductase subunit B
VAVPYALAVLAFFSFQVTLANLGALHLVLPNLAMPVAAERGRAIHLNLAVFWPAVGLMGATYYFLIHDLRTPIWSRRLAMAQFWLSAAALIGTIGALALGFTEGREYLEAPWFFKLLIVLGLFLFTVNILVTLARRPDRALRPVPIIVALSVPFSGLLLLAATFWYHNPSVDEMMRFWVVHMWEEGSLDLLASVAIVALLARTRGVAARTAEGWLLLEAGLIVFSGALGTGHHYYWIGLPAFWITVGAVFSFVQVVPIAMLGRLTLSAARDTGPGAADWGLLRATWFILSAVAWNVIGAGLIGLAITVPTVNRYIHGTYVTSGHAHLALGGFFGFLVLGLVLFILDRYRPTDAAGRRDVGLSLWLLNAGMALMGAALLTAGTVEVVRWRVVGNDFVWVQSTLRPFLFVRSVGGLVFAAGGLFFTWGGARPYVWANLPSFARPLLKPLFAGPTAKAGRPKRR